MTEVGCGSTSAVYASAYKAVKVTSHDNFASAVCEAALVSICDHPNIISFDRVSFGENETQFRMKKYECDLFTFIAKRQLTSSEIYSISDDITSGLHYLHGRGIIHCDLKTQNVLIDVSDDTLRAIICDFGISTLINEVRHSSSVQTCTYRAPEINADKALIRFGPKIDVWSLGCILFELVTRRNLFLSAKEDPSISACEFLELPLSNDRIERMELLRAVNLPRVKRCLIAKLGANKTTVNADYVDIMAKCLMPHYIKRATSVSALISLKQMLNNNVMPNIKVPVPRAPDREDSEQFAMPAGTKPEILNACSPPCRALTKKIYKRCNGITYIDYYAALVIASTIYAGSSSAICILQTHRIWEDVVDRVISISQALNGNVLD